MLQWQLLDNYSNAISNSRTFVVGQDIEIIWGIRIKAAYDTL